MHARPTHCFASGMHSAYCVYILKTAQAPTRYYTGITTNLSSRLAEHNGGRCTYTARARRWEVVVSINFADRHRAIQFERYLKSGSGSAFARRHFR